MLNWSMLNELVGRERDVNKLGWARLDLLSKLPQQAKFVCDEQGGCVHYLLKG